MALSLVSYLPNLVQNDFWVRKKFMGMKKFWVENDFGLTKNVVFKKIWVKKNWGFKILLSPWKILGSKKFGTKTVGQIFILAKKKIKLVAGWRFDFCPREAISNKYFDNFVLTHQYLPNKY